MHVLTIKLKQHTPLIHFQHDQEGATLRASEVKPKLDKFILSKLTPEEKSEGKHEGWIKSKNDKVWLDYKMRIESSEDLEEYLLASYIKRDDLTILDNNGISAISDTPFFAQEKQNSQILRSNHPSAEWDKIEKKGIIEKKEVTVVIVSKNNKIIEYLSMQVQPFFVVTNFGTRQSKGFGSFVPTKIKLNDSPIDLVEIDTLLKKHFKFVYKKRIRNNTLADVLSTINNDYKLLKSGLTRNKYAKSKLLLYAESLDSNIGWDKKYIKVNVNNGFLNENNDKYILKCKKEHQRDSYREKRDYRYYRAVLGLAEQYEFLLENPPRGLSKNKMIVKVKNGDIQRYKSPLLFKVIDNNIYLVGNDVAPEILDKPFNFLVNFQGDSGYTDEPVNENGNPIKTPEFFSLGDFISFAMQDNTNGASLGYETIKS